MNDEMEDTRQERREKKQEKKKERVPQHGRSLAHIYKEAILRRINKLRADKQKGQKQ
ncbi:hypothetical protein ACFLYG_04150 [Chloroflexota bacterium]